MRILLYILFIFPLKFLAQEISLVDLLESSTDIKKFEQTMFNRGLNLEDKRLDSNMYAYFTSYKNGYTEYIPTNSVPEKTIFVVYEPQNIVGGGQLMLDKTISFLELQKNYSQNQQQELFNKNLLIQKDLPSGKLYVPGLIYYNKKYFVSTRFRKVQSSSYFSTTYFENYCFIKEWGKLILSKEVTVNCSNYHYQKLLKAIQNLPSQYTVNYIETKNDFGNLTIHYEVMVGNSTSKILVKYTQPKDVYSDGQISIKR